MANLILKNNTSGGTTSVTADYFLGKASHLGEYPADWYFRRGNNLENITLNSDYETNKTYWVTNTATDLPQGQWGTLVDFAPNHSQLFFTYCGNDDPVSLHTRAYVNGVWQPWSKILQTGEDINVSHIQIRNATSTYPALHIYNGEATTPSAGFSVNVTNNQIYITEHCLNNAYYEQYYLPTPATNLSANKAYSILTTKSTITIAQGGTGATTAANALKNFGLTATATELNYCDGVTSNIQTQLDSKWRDHGTITIATNDDGSSQSVYGISDLDNATKLGSYWVQCNGIVNVPSGVNYGLLEVRRGGGNIFQRFTTCGSSRTSTIYERDNVNGWKPWRITTPYTYGLGTGAPYTSNLNTEFNGGFTRWDTGGTGRPFVYGSMLTIPRAENTSCGQLAVCHEESNRGKWMVRVGTTSGFTAWDQLVTSSICPQHFYYTHIVSGAISPTTVANAIKAGTFGSYNVFVARVSSVDTTASEAVVIGSNAMVGSGVTHSAFIYCGYGWDTSGQSNFFKCRIHDDVLEVFEL